MKFCDYGKMAATFVNLETQTAVRIIARENSRERTKELFPEVTDQYAAQVLAYKVMSNEELFDMMPVHVDIPPADMPGRPLKRVSCSRCGEDVRDMRDICRNGEVLCKACANGAYYVKIGETRA
jgi:formylmethanofuran dehydrogenase subunit E